MVPVTVVPLKRVKVPVSVANSAKLPVVPVIVVPETYTKSPVPAVNALN